MFAEIIKHSHLFDTWMKSTTMLRVGSKRMYRLPKSLGSFSLGLGSVDDNYVGLFYWKQSSNYLVDRNISFKSRVCQLSIMEFQPESSNRMFTSSITVIIYKCFKAGSIISIKFAPGYVS